LVAPELETKPDKGTSIVLGASSLLALFADRPSKYPAFVANTPLIGRSKSVRSDRCQIVLNFTQVWLALFHKPLTDFTKSTEFAFQKCHSVAK
jgi:hypothetical protein